MADVKNNLRATAYPQVTDDSSAGYSQGSTWYYGGTMFACRSATVGAAVWAPVAVEEAWPSNTYRMPDNFVSAASVQATDLTKDVLALFPFVLRRPIGSIGIYLNALGTAGATAAPKVLFGLYAHDYATGKAGARVANMGSFALDSGATGLRAAGSTVDTFGLYWVSVHIRMILGSGGVGPTFMQMTAANGRHVHRADGTDLAQGFGYPCYYSNDTYPSNDSPPGTLPTINGASPRPVVPMPIVRAA